jgi:hypothetical protein
MKLNADVLYYHLSQKYRVSYRKGDNSSEELGRPRYHDGGVSPAGCLLLLSGSGSPVGPGTYLGFWEPVLTDPGHTTLFLLPPEEDPREIYNELQNIYDFYDEWENACLQIVEKYQDFRSLIRQTWQSFQVPVCLVDNQFTIVSSAHEENSPFALFEDESQINLDTVNDIISNPHMRNLETARGIFDFDYDRNYKLYNFRSGGKYCGRLIMGIRDARFSGRDSLILGKLAEFVELLLQRYGSFQSTSSVQTYLHSFLADSLAGKVPHSREINRLSQNTGWSENHNYLMVYFLPEHRLKKELYPPYLISQVEERWRGACATEYQGNVVLLLNLSMYGRERLPDFYQSLAYLVRDGLMIAGCSRCFSGLRELNVYFKQSIYAIEFGRKKDSTRWYFRFDDYGLEYLLSYGTGIFKPEQVCHPALLQLRKHDQTRQTSYYSTLFTYFEQQFNMSQAANRLYIHRSTFINRMERIQELTRLNLNDYDTRLYLELSFRLLQEPEEAYAFPLYT